MTKKYQWPASALTRDDMEALFKEKIKTQTPINELIRMAVTQMLKKEP